MKDDIIEVLIDNDYTYQEASVVVDKYGFNESLGALANARIIIEAHMEDLDNA